MIIVKIYMNRPSQVLSCLVKDGDDNWADDGSTGRVSPLSKVVVLPSFCPKHAEALRSVSRPFRYGFVKVRPTRVRIPRSSAVTRAYTRACRVQKFVSV